MTVDPAAAREFALSVAMALAPAAGFAALASRARRARVADRAGTAEHVFVVLAECAAGVLVTVLLWPLR